MTPEQITYIENINEAMATYTLDLARKEAIGVRKTSKRRSLLSILNIAIGAITQYIDGIEEDASFCEEVQAQKYVDIINIITNENLTYN
jgi:hypothetical protein